MSIKIQKKMAIREQIDPFISLHVFLSYKSHDERSNCRPFGVKISFVLFFFAQKIIKLSNFYDDIYLVNLTLHTSIIMSDRK